MLYDKVDNENQGLECIVRHYEHVVCLLQGRQHVMKCQQSVVVVLSGRSNALISRWDCWTVWQRGGDYNVFRYRAKFPSSKERSRYRQDKSTFEDDFKDEVPRGSARIEESLLYFTGIWQIWRLGATNQHFKSGLTIEREGKKTARKFRRLFLLLDRWPHLKHEKHFKKKKWVYLGKRFHRSFQFYVFSHFFKTDSELTW